MVGAVLEPYGRKSLIDSDGVAESVIDGVLHPELRDRMILLRGKPIRRTHIPNLVLQRPTSPLTDVAHECHFRAV